MFFLGISPIQQSKYNDYNIRIVAKCPRGGQLYKLFCLFIGRYLTLEKLIRAIKAGQLTEVGEILESIGVTHPELINEIIKQFQDDLGGVA
ncbi:hypothetical protein NCWK1_5432 [Nostoc cycadae WK-1]|uniref:Uncharacterized protein n=1 Tax=Nostoc cycadae WK-1 TaxID=1861711 RepID=A0A2H6LR31_9NOSO|nr:hypothetical protein NCWK1_5432 [Nostoc cycadae WK-1]